MSGKTLAKAVSILDCFTKEEPVWTAIALSRRLGIPATTLHGLLAALLSMDFLSQSKQSKEYRLGFRYLEMGRQHLDNSELSGIAQGVMRNLVFGTNLLGLNVMYNGWMYNAVTVLPLKNTNAFNFVGPKMPAHFGTGGMVIMAHLPDEDLRRYCEIDWEKRGFPPFGGLSEIRGDLAEIRRKGYGVGQSLVSFAKQSTLAAPVFGRGKGILAALVLLSTEKPFSAAKIADYSKSLCLAANEITRRCGHLSQQNSFV